MGFDSVDEWGSLDHVGEQLGAVQEPPAPLSGLHQLEDHGEARLSRAVSFGAAMPQSDRGERALDGIGRAQVTPVLGREVVEREQHVAVL